MHNMFIMYLSHKLHNVSRLPRLICVPDRSWFGSNEGVVACRNWSKPLILCILEVLIVYAQPNTITNSKKLDRLMQKFQGGQNLLLSKAWKTLLLSTLNRGRRMNRVLELAISLNFPNKLNYQYFTQRWEHVEKMIISTIRCHAIWGFEDWRVWRLI